MTPAGKSPTRVAGRCLPCGGTLVTPALYPALFSTLCFYAYFQELLNSQDCTRRSRLCFTFVFMVRVVVQCSATVCGSCGAQWRDG